MRMNRGIRFVLPLVVWLIVLGTAQAASASVLQYYGGPVAHSMRVVLVEWGPDVRSTYSNASTGDPAFFSYLASQSGSTTDIGGVLAQYMDTSGANSQNKFSYDTLVQITPPSSGGSGTCLLPSCVEDTTIQSTLQSDISSDTLPAPGGALSTIYVVLFPPNVDVCMDGSGSCAYDSNGFCAYHSAFEEPSSTQVLYAAIVDDGPATPNYGLCGPSSNDLDNQTDVVSHEFSETINDPLVAEASSFDAPLAWYDPDPNTGGEVADICEGPDEQASNGPWTVQKIWSNLDNACVAGESAFAAPTASFLSPSTGTLGAPVTFDASSSSDPSGDHASATCSSGTGCSGDSYAVSSGIAGYQWNWGDGGPTTVTSTAAASHTYSSAGTYQVSLTVTDELGFTSTVTQPITIESTGGGVPAVQTGSATGITDGGATLTGTINPEGQTGQYEFAYGTSPGALSDATPETTLPAGTSSSAISATLSGLSPSSTYYYQLEAITNGGATTTLGTVNSFTTTAAPPSPPPSTSPQTPVVSTGAAAQIATAGALVSGTINPGGSQAVSYDFAYGSSPAGLGSTTASETLSGGTTAVSVGAALDGLAPATTYYYELNVDFDGQTYPGAVQSFTTSAPAPSVTTGGASRISSTGATVSGTVDPHGAPATYLVEFGTTKSYGHSSVSLSAGPGTSSVAVSVVLAGLKASTTYHYRFVATSAGGTVVGADHTFRTSHAPASAPRFSFTVHAPSDLSATVARGLRVRFRCSKACVAYFTVNVANTGGITRLDPVALTIARGRGRIRSAGSGTATVTFISKIRSRLRGAKSLRLVISGYAVGPGTAPSRAKVTRLTLP